MSGKIRGGNTVCLKSHGKQLCKTLSKLSGKEAYMLKPLSDPKLSTLKMDVTFCKLDGTMNTWGLEPS